MTNSNEQYKKLDYTNDWDFTNIIVPVQKNGQKSITLSDNNVYFDENEKAWIEINPANRCLNDNKRFSITADENDFDKTIFRVPTSHYYDSLIASGGIHKLTLAENAEKIKPDTIIKTSETQKEPEPVVRNAKKNIDSVIVVKAFNTAFFHLFRFCDNDMNKTEKMIKDLFANYKKQQKKEQREKNAG